MENEKAIRLLLDNGADANKKDRGGVTPLDMARSRRPDLEDILKEASAKPTDKWAQQGAGIIAHITENPKTGLSIKEVFNFNSGQYLVFGLDKQADKQTVITHKLDDIDPAWVKKAKEHLEEKKSGTNDNAPAPAKATAAPGGP
jgi:hypothetical protein